MMASRLLLLVALVLVVLCVADQVSSDVQIVEGGAKIRKLLPVVDCGVLCSARCSMHSRPRVCARACGTCCMRCKCVPPGTSGNRELCGSCYTDMTTHANKTKCP